MYGGGKIVLYLIRDKPSYYGTLIESRSECLPPRDTMLRHTCYHNKFCRSRANRLGVVVEIRPKNLTPSLSPFKVIQGQWKRQRSFDYQWLPNSAAAVVVVVHAAADAVFRRTRTSHKLARSIGNSNRILHADQTTRREYTPLSEWYPVTLGLFYPAFAGNSNNYFAASAATAEVCALPAAVLI